MKRLLVMLIACFLLGCAGVDVNHYARQGPTLDLPSYFNGTIDAWGVFQKRNGEVARRFKVEMRCSWVGDTGTLDERFVYDDGETQRRVWTLTRQADGSWQGRADDVLGVAVGRVAGNALHWRYTIKLPVDGTVYEVAFDDWMWLLDEQTMFNRSTMSKFGVNLGEVSLFFRKRS
ncbi:DUF3833 domain-containing protein [Chitinimonas viridis]|uniref:DUF3833 domain-containing protein n=1 Tax=Chitinimonas viridis TaxID=664880 RepID=A0ABT8B6P8_9NEIS|nr:DUF3833 domain-containing protein [Chitinimonas viridis]MDN3577316.1 DUF3833 domain-containing protein [Chitinimonas viridis]